MSSHVGRNDACPCGSGKKYKKYCLGTEASSQSEPGNWKFPAARDQPFDPSRTETPDRLNVIQDALGLMQDDFPPLPDGMDDWFDEFYLAEPGEKIALLRKLVAEARPIEDYEAMDFADLVLAPAVWTDDAVRRLHRIRPRSLGQSTVTVPACGGMAGARNGARSRVEFARTRRPASHPAAHRFSRSAVGRDV